MVVICPYSSSRPLASQVPSPALDTGVTSGGRRPVLLWTAHSAAKAAAPCVSGRRQGANTVPGGSLAPGLLVWSHRFGEVRWGKTLPLETSNLTLVCASQPGLSGRGIGCGHVARVSGHSVRGG